MPEFMQQSTDLHSWLPIAIGGFVNVFKVYFPIHFEITVTCFGVMHYPISIKKTSDLYHFTSTQFFKILFFPPSQFLWMTESGLGTEFNQLTIIK